MTTIRIPSPLRPYTAGQVEINIQGSTVVSALNDMVARYPDLRPHLFTEDGELRVFINLFLNEEDIRQLEGLNTPLKEGDRLMLVPSVAGG